jgi:putative hydrolase of the HAD superfamily
MTQLMYAPHIVLGVVFDGDDTLWSTEQLYDDARSRARNVVAESGLDAAKWEEWERRIDVQNVDMLGYSMERFPTSCVQAYEELCRSTRRDVDTATADRVRQAARSVFERDPPLVSGARETLTFLRAKGIRLALLTKGDHDLQSRRMERSGLRDLFDVVKIVPEKSPAIIRDVVAALGVDVGSAWMVGNSIRSDVLPAIDAGLRAVWISAHVWEYERAYDQVAVDGVITASHLADVPALIAA